jgi:hypothetical protein
VRVATPRSRTAPIPPDRPARGYLAAALVLACGEQDPRRAFEPFDVEIPADQLPSKDESRERFVMERTTERCEVIVSLGGAEVRRLPERFACPKDLELGERIVLLGRTCRRESDVRDRNLPVLCPDYLTGAERDALASSSASARPASSR